MNRRTPCALIAALAVILVAPGLSFAQSTALLTGTVVDPSGAVVPAANVTCRNVETDLKASATTNAAGLFRFPDLPVGLYELTVAKEGFGSLVRGGASAFPWQGTYNLTTDAVNPWKGIFNWGSGFPTDRYVAPAFDRSRANLTGASMIDPNYGVGEYTQQWNFNLQRTLPGNVLLDIGYMGGKAASAGAQPIRFAAAYQRLARTGGRKSSTSHSSGSPPW